MLINDEVATAMGASASWPTQILVWADIFELHNPDFDKEKFVRRATKAWEDNYDPPYLDDHIPY